ncbi:MAG TPA: hypothetical protein VNO22_08330 [Planctomycetota bacterium]|nr:hypothetical protein [Planctomycetota bacterium]
MSAFLAIALSLQGADLVYERRATREETREASLRATLAEIPEVRLEPWKVLEGNVRGGIRALSARSGAIDLAAEVPLEGGRTGRWTDGSAYADGTAHRPATATTWYRVVVAEGALDATVTIGTERDWDCWVNGEPVSLATHKSTHLLPSKRLDFRLPLRKGVNHLLIEVRGPSEVYFSLSRLSPELRIELERLLDADFPTPASEPYYYRLETVRLPPGLVLEVGGMMFARDGTLLVCTRRGEVWKMKDGTWSLFASGLHEPLGLWAEDPADVAVVQRTELTRLRDTDGDGVADLYEALSRGWNPVARPTAYAFGPIRDAEGNFWGATAAQGAREGRYLGWCFKVTPEGEFIPWASGLRTPNGLGFDREGRLFVTDNQGEYVGTSALYAIRRGAFYGHPHSLSSDPEMAGRAESPTLEELDARRTLPAVQFPHGLLGRSPSQPLVDATGGKFGPFEGQFFVGDQSSCILIRVALETVEGEPQGACFPFRSGFQSGNNRLAWGPDGVLWVGQTDRGFGAVGGRPFGLERVTWTGRVPFEILDVRARPDGFELRFTRPADRAVAARPEAYSIQRYHYLYHATYGSPQADVTPVAVREARVSEDGRRVALVLGELVERKIYEIHLRGVRAEDGAPLLHGEAYYTLNRRPRR